MKTTLLFAFLTALAIACSSKPSSENQPASSSEAVVSCSGHTDYDDCLDCCFEHFSGNAADDCIDGCGDGKHNGGSSSGNNNNNNNNNSRPPND